jgi:hypothetical protein
MEKDIRLEAGAQKAAAIRCRIRNGSWVEPGKTGDGVTRWGRGWTKTSPVAEEYLSYRLLEASKYC